MAPNVHPVYTWSFLTIDPLMGLSGFIAASALPQLYLHMTSPHTHALSEEQSGIPVAYSVVMAQLANMYLLFAIITASVLRSTDNLQVWRTFQFGLLVSDLGHLWSVRELGLDIYWKAWEWNGMAFGNVGISYGGVLLRSLFLLGVGVSGGGGRHSSVVKTQTS